MAWNERKPSGDITIETVDELPPRVRGRKVSPFYVDVARRARENPASWVVLRGYRTSAIATQMRQGKYPAIDPADHEIECRRNADGVRYDLFVKYIGKIVE